MKDAQNLLGEVKLQPGEDASLRFIGKALEHAQNAKGMPPMPARLSAALERLTTVQYFSTTPPTDVQEGDETLAPSAKGARDRALQKIFNFNIKC